MQDKDTTHSWWYTYIRTGDMSTLVTVGHPDLIMLATSHPWTYAVWGRLPFP